MYKRIVVKLGTSVLTGGSRQLDQARMVEIARQCASLYAQGQDVVVCTSGAVAAGRAHLNFPALSPAITSKQLLAAVGQLQLMRVWERLFDIYGVRVGQILLTRSDVENRQRYINARDAFTALLEQRIMPIVNENDAVATEEIRVGDNDNLSALVATLVSADLLILLTDQAGLFTADPRRDPQAQFVHEAKAGDPALEVMAGGAGSSIGKGGMITKIVAAKRAAGSGASTVIAWGREPDVLLRLARGEAIGTLLVAQTQKKQARKRWMVDHLQLRGSVTVDAGAAAKLRGEGKSLLPIGMVAVEGDFARGDVIAVRDAGGTEIARGLANYASAEARRLCRKPSSEFERLLGYAAEPEMVHRDNMVVFTA